MKNPQNEGGVIKIEIRDVPALWAYIIVVAAITDGNNIEYESYKGVAEVRPYVPPEGSTEGISPVVFIVVGGLLLLIVIGLIVAVVIFNIRNKSLLNQVKHVSFQKSNSNTDPNLLLNKSQQSSTQEQQQTSSPEQ